MYETDVLIVGGDAVRMSFAPFLSSEARTRRRIRHQRCESAAEPPRVVTRMHSRLRAAAAHCISLQKKGLARTREQSSYRCTGVPFQARRRWYVSRTPRLFAAIVSLIATELRSFDDLRDDRCLGICVVLNLLPFLLSQSQLCPGIQLSVAGIPSQPISK